MYTMHPRTLYVCVSAIDNGTAHMPKKCHRESRMGTNGGGKNMSKTEATIVIQKLNKNEIAHIVDEPRDLLLLPKTQTTEPVYEQLKGKHDGDLILEMVCGKDKTCIEVAEIIGHVTVRRKWIRGEYWKRYYSIRFARNIDKTLKIVPCK